MNFVTTLFRPITIKPCRDRRPRRSKKQQILLFTWLQIIAGCNFKILSFSDRRGRRSLQAKCLTISTRRYGAKKHRFRVVEGADPYKKTREFAVQINSKRSCSHEDFSRLRDLLVFFIQFQQQLPQFSWRIRQGKPRRHILRESECFRHLHRWSPRRGFLPP